MNIRNRRPLCNNNPASAPCFNGKCFLLCWRCTGALVASLIITIISFTMNYSWSLRPVLFLLVIPASIDYILTRKHIISPSNFRRFTTGLMLGLPSTMIILSVFG